MTPKIKSSDYFLMHHRQKLGPLTGYKKKIKSCLGDYAPEAVLKVKSY